MFPVILFLLVLIFICLWNCQLYAYFLRLAFYSLAHLWGFEHLGPLTLLLGLCESVTYVKAVSLLIRQLNNRLRWSVILVKAVGLFKTSRLSEFFRQPNYGFYRFIPLIKVVGLFEP